jgi:nucleoside 2-deoxyribosyltransferase
MSFNAKVFKILIASPGDVNEEREAIPEVIARWNNTNAESNEVVLLPVKWETHAAPLLGDRAQGVINSQIVTSCDMVIGVFWTRLGSPTGVSESGTAEEIEWFIQNGKPVMVYFSSRALDPTKLDIDQYKALKEFEKKMQKLGLTGSYTSITDFTEKLLNQISVNVRLLLSGTPAAVPSPREVKEKAESLKKIVKEGRVYMEDYEKDGKVKSFLVKGDTKVIKDELKELGGRWNGSLGGWVFPKTREIEIADFIKKNV